jgi:polar amino acid transport system substrate-binding protein
MRLLLLSLLLCSASLSAEPRPLRFPISESWAMPMVEIDEGRPTRGILYDLQLRLAQKVGRRAEMQVMPRLRVQQMLVRGEIDVRCYVNPAWLEESHHQYIWSVPFMVQRDLLVGRPGDRLAPLPGETIGTVLGFSYPQLQSDFNAGQLVREDARTQELALAKLVAERYRFTVSNELALQWFNRQQPANRKLQVVREIASDIVACIVRDEPDVPTMQLLRALVQMSNDGEFDAILARYR